jgi:hypothetical protein
VTASGRPSREESRPPSARGRLPSAASAPLVCTRSSGRIGERWSIKVDQGNPGTGARANPKPHGVGRVPQRDGRWARCPRRTFARSRSPGCPSSACSSWRRAGGRVRSLSWFFFLRGNLAAVAAQPFKKRFGSNGTCLRHRW